MNSTSMRIHRSVLAGTCGTSVVHGRCAHRPIQPDRHLRRQPVRQRETTRSLFGTDAEPGDHRQLVLRDHAAVRIRHLQQRRVSGASFLGARSWAWTTNPSLRRWHQLRVRRLPHPRWRQRPSQRAEPGRRSTSAGDVSQASPTRCSSSPPAATTRSDRARVASAAGAPIVPHAAGRDGHAAVRGRCWPDGRQACRPSGARQPRSSGTRPTSAVVPQRSSPTAASSPSVLGARWSPSS